MSAERKFPGKVFLTVEEISDCLVDFRVFDTRYNLKIKDYGKVEYAKGHIEGAISVNVDLELCAPLTSTARHPMPEPSDFIEWCKAHGISQGQPALCYDDECGAMGACRMWWMLDALGVEAYVLDGGIQAYRASGLPMETGESKLKATSATFWPFGDRFVNYVTYNEIPPNATLVDARAAGRFDSTVRPYGGDVLPGHIEGARNLPYQMHIFETSDTKRLRALDEIRSNTLRVLDGAWKQGQPPDLSTCVFYCGSGISAAMNLALVRHLGLGHPLFYCGSWSEYAGVFRFPLTRHILCEHGMWFEMLSPNLGDNKKVDVDLTPFRVDGAECNSLDPEILAAVTKLHMGEKARVYFKSGRVAVIEAPIHH